MVEFEVSVHPRLRMAYIPRKLVETFGTKLKIKPDAKAGIVYPEGADLEAVIRSLEILLEDLRLQAGH